jgi:hypothetical protein
VKRKGKIAQANRGRDPLYLFAALQRHLGYPEVPRRSETNLDSMLDRLQTKLRELETRLKLMEMEQRHARPEQTRQPGIFVEKRR